MKKRFFLSKCFLTTRIKKYISCICDIHALSSLCQILIGWQVAQPIRLNGGLTPAQLQSPSLAKWRDVSSIRPRRRCVRGVTMQEAEQSECEWSHSLSQTCDSLSVRFILQNHNLSPWNLFWKYTPIHPMKSRTLARQYFSIHFCSSSTWKSKERMKWKIFKKKESSVFLLRAWCRLQHWKKDKKGQRVQWQWERSRLSLA